MVSAVALGLAGTTAESLIAPLRAELAAFVDGRALEDDLTVVVIRRA